MSAVLEKEPEPQPAAAPPVPPHPKHTAVGTDDSERRPCRRCGHTRKLHMTVPCSGMLDWKSSGFTTINYRCSCSRYDPAPQH